MKRITVNALIDIGCLITFIPSLVPYLGAIPIDPEMVKSGDEGRPYILRHADSPTWRAVDTVMKNLVARIEAKSA